MTILEKADKILLFIKEKSDLGLYIPKEYIWIHYISLTPELGINRQQFDEIFERFLKDDLLRKRDIEEAKPTYHLTVKGHEFKGYVEVVRLEVEQKALEDKNQKSLLASSWSMSRWTKWIAFGTIALVLLTLFALLKECSTKI